MAKHSAKRDHLIDTAKKLIYQKGFNVTTLSDIALEVDLPLGNIYYYFKTKNDIGIAILDAMILLQQNIFQQLDKEPSPKNRLLDFLEQAKQDAKLIARQGSEIGTLCQEFGKKGGILANLSAKVIMNVLLWMEIQFYALGFIKEAPDLSLDLMYKLEGIFLLGYAFRDPNLITRQIALVQDYLKERIAEHERVPKVLSPASCTS
ncbi:MAG TPA: TetR/AcrR family transcriptional regulator [Gammaproteobacteria bacterium]|nr:TetR/AcrR family transcriptional regulator [Gammaproteobacteria bacterium]